MTPLCSSDEVMSLEALRKVRKHCLLSRYCGAIITQPGSSISFSSVLTSQWVYEVLFHFLAAELPEIH